jgi:hypothetical protein
MAGNFSMPAVISLSVMPGATALTRSPWAALAAAAPGRARQELAP